MAFVYWIHLPEHKDLMSEGYIGFTNKTVEERYKGHLKEARSSRSVGLNYPIYNALRKYKGEVIVTTLLEGSKDYCLMIEEKLRPNPKIGWNLTRGGNVGKLGKEFSDETRAKISEAGRRRIISEETRVKLRFNASQHKHSDETKLRISKSKLGKHRTSISRLKQSKTLKDQPWRNSHANPKIWIIADVMSNFLLLNPEIKLTEFANYFNLKVTNVCTIFKKLKNGWCPFEDKFWIEFRDNYKEGECPHIN